MATPVTVNNIDYPSVRETASKTVFVNGKGYSPDTAKIITDQKQKNQTYDKELKYNSSNPVTVMGDPSNKGGRRRRRNRSTKRRNISRRRKMTKRRK